MSDLAQRVATALADLPVRDSIAPGGELDQLRLREAARAAINETLEASAERVERMYGNKVYMAAWRKTARMLRAMKY